VAQPPEEVGIIPAGPQAANLNAAFEGGFLPDEVDGQMAQEGGVFGAVVGADALGILPKSDIEHPVEAVFDAPVGTHDLEQIRRRTRQAGQAKSGFYRAVVSEAALAAYPHQRLKLGPGCRIVEEREAVGVGKRPAIADFKSPVVFLDRPRLVGLRAAGGVASNNWLTS